MSAVIALTLSPMMCSRILASESRGSTSRFENFVDRSFEQLRHAYERLLKGALNSMPVVAVFALIILGSIYFLYKSSKRELAPQEDEGVIISMITAAPDATLKQTGLSTREVYKIFAGYDEGLTVSPMTKYDRNIQSPH